MSTSQREMSPSEVIDEKIMELGDWRGARSLGSEL
jgi:hypothetical protein